MIKVLWMYNSITADFADAFGVRKTNAAGWISGMLNAVRGETNIQVISCFPIKNREKIREGTHNGIEFCSLLVGTGELDSSEIIENTKTILNRYKPDIVHIWGTEHFFSRDIMTACVECNMKKVLIDLQGNIEAMRDGLRKCIPSEVFLAKEGDIESLEEHYNRWDENAKREKQMIEMASYACGRTKWDHLYTLLTNARISYYHCDRMFRPSFYLESRKWELAKCRSHQIFISQGFYPVKGLHIFVQALPYVLKYYDDVSVVIGANDSFIKGNKEGKISPYGAYINDLAVELGVRDRLIFTGLLSEQEMIEQILAANIMVSPSVVENNSNSVCEAMYLGLPVIASNVGGIPSIIKDGETGLLYSYDDVRMLAGLICLAFNDTSLLESLSVNGLRAARRRHNPDILGKKMVDIYKAIMLNNNGGNIIDE